MGWHYTPYALILLAVTAVSVTLALHAWRLRDTPGAKELALLLAAVSVWSFGYGLEFPFTDLGVKVFWASVQYLGVVTVPVAWAVFALRYTGRGGWISRRNLLLLSVVPVMTLALMWTNGAHHLFWTSVGTDPSRTFLLVEHGVPFWIFVLYSYVLVAFGTFLMLSMILRSTNLYRGQGGALLAGVAAPWVGNGINLIGLNPFPRLDPTSFTFLISGAAVSWALFRFRLLDIVPVARDTVIEVMNDAVIVTDAQRRVVDLNPAAQNILRRLSSEVVGSPLARVEPGLDALLDVPGDEEEAHKEISLGKDTERRDYDLALSSLRDRKGRTTGYLLVLRDVTERRRAERELEHFAYLIAHDLRAPLRTISGFSHVLAEDYSAALDEMGRSYLDRTRSAAQRMGEMIDDLLDLSRLTRSEMRRETVDLTSLATTIAEELREGNPERSTELVITEGLTTVGDPRLLRVALRNLLENAWKFTAGEQRARIEFGVASQDGYPTYHVRDNGAGFDMAYSGKLFRAFQRLHTADEFEGSGIGLAAVARVIERHGGRIWAEGEVGKGATFYFTL